MMQPPVTYRPHADRKSWPLRGGTLRVALVTNIPAPYRVPMYERLARLPGLALQVFFCSDREANRHWDLEPPGIPHHFLRERVLHWRGRFIHVNPDVWPMLGEFGPDVVVTTGFNPTHLLAFAFACRHGARHVAMTDGTARSEAVLSGLHRWVRRRVYRRTQAFVGAGEGSMALYRGYGIAPEAMFKSPLCTGDNPAFEGTAAARLDFGQPRDIDFIFCGRFVGGKLPLFAIEVAAAAATRLGRRVRLLFVGSGELEEQMRRRVASVADRVDAEFAGFATQAELPHHYARARLLLFPTRGDTWGVVANEAAAAGVVVFVSPEAGVAGDLVVDGVNGRVMHLDVATWANAAVDVLSAAETWQRLSAAALRSVADHTPARAAIGLASAIAHAARSRCESRRPSGFAEHGA